MKITFMFIKILIEHNIELKQRVKDLEKQIESLQYLLELRSK